MLVMARPNMAEKSFWDIHAKVVSTSFGTHTQSFGTHTQSGHIHSGTHTRMLSQVHSSHQSVTGAGLGLAWSHARVSESVLFWRFMLGCDRPVAGPARK